MNKKENSAKTDVNSDDQPCLSCCFSSTKLAQHKVTQSAASEHM